jgi:hypothetical protein
MVDVHGLLEVHMAVTPASLEHGNTPGVHARRLVELRQAVGGDGAAEAGAGDQDVDLLGYRRNPLFVRSLASFFR